MMRNCSKSFLVILILIFTLTGLLTSCLSEEASNNTSSLPSEINLSTITEKTQLSDFTDFGWWSVSFPLSILEGRIRQDSHYALKTSSGTFEFQPNIADSNRLICFLPQAVSKDSIEQGKIIVNEESKGVRSRNSELTIEKVIIIGEDIRNATNTYEMTLLHYIQFKDANAYLVYDSEGKLIRPEYIKSNEENAYTLQRYYNARQVVSDHRPDAVLKFLRGRDDHEELLFFGNANRVGYEGTITYQEPDQRDRLRELGNMGELSNSANVYDLERDTINSRTVVNLQSNRLNSQYDNATFYYSDIKESTRCHFSKSGNTELYTLPVSFDTTQSTEVIKNLRFGCSKNKILLFNSEEIFQTGYTNINTAVSEAESGDIIRVVDNTIISNTNNDAKITEEIYISSKNLAFESLHGDLYTIDMENLSTRAFRINSSTTTINNAIITNGALSNKMGAGIKANSSKLFINDSIIATNTVNANSSGYYGGGLYLSSSDVVISNSTITNNSINKGQGGGLYFTAENQHTMLIKQCHFSENTSSKNGAGMHISGGKLVEIRSCSIVDNHISGEDSDYLNGGGVSVLANHTSLIITDTLIASNSALKYGGGIICGVPSATITNIEFRNNVSLKEGGAVYFDDYAGGQNTAFYSNTIISNNSSDTQANGVYVEDRSTIYNTDGTNWIRFNSPLSTLSFTENTNNNLNIYSGQGTESGNDISFEGIQTTAGTLDISPNTGEEQSSTIVTVDYVIGCEFHGGTLTIKIPTGFEITEDASLIIDGVERRVDEYSWSAQQIELSNLNLETGTITLRLENQEIPDGVVHEMMSARNVNYLFGVIADADGSETSWNPSAETSVDFLSINKPANINIKIKSGYDYLSLLSRDSTEILFDEDTQPQTTAASITQALESTDGTTQDYLLYKADGASTVTLSDNDIIPSEATLCVTAAHGNTHEYRVFAGTLNFNLVKSNGNNSLHLTLTEAIEALVTSETGTIYILTSTVQEPELIIDDGKTLTILPTTTISGNAILDGKGEHRVLKISGGASVTLKNITVQNGYLHNDNGAGILVNGGTLILESCLVDNNKNNTGTSGYGGGIYNQHGTVRLIDSVISNNKAVNGGGYSQNNVGGLTYLYFISGTMQNNSANTTGGGIFHGSGYIRTPNDSMWGNGNPTLMIPNNSSIDNNGNVLPYNPSTYAVHLINNSAGNVNTHQYGR